MRSIRAGSGLGDSIYLAAVVRLLVERGAGDLEVLTDFPDLFLPLRDKVKLAPYRRRPRADIIAHYAGRRAVPGTSQFQDCCIGAGLPATLPFHVAWTIINRALIERLHGAAQGRPIVLVQLPRAPFGRSDGFGQEFLPDCRRIQQAIDLIGVRAFTVLVGSGAASFQYRGIGLDLSNQTSVSDLMDVGFAADGFLGQCSFIIPLAEGQGKPVQLVWSRRGLRSRHEVIRQMTPGKILHGPWSRAVMDNCSDEQMRVAIDALCEQVGRARAA